MDPADTNLDQATRQLEVERAQIGHEIHDGLLPLIFAASSAVSSVIDQAESDDARQRLQQASDWLADAMQFGRRLLTEVYPPELAGTTWTAAASDALQRLIDPGTTTIDWQIDDEASDVAATDAAAAYRIVVEAVRNAIRHGQATEVKVSARCHQAGLQVVIQDNGGGFLPAEIPDDRYGIRSMKGRAALVGGRLAIESKPGGPTTVTFNS